MWLNLCNTVHLVIPNLCTKFHNPTSSSSWEIFDGKKVYRQTNIVTKKAKTIYPLYTLYAGGIMILKSSSNSFLSSLLIFWFIDKMQGRQQNWKLCTFRDFFFIIENIMRIIFLLILLPIFWLKWNKSVFKIYFHKQNFFPYEDKTLLLLWMLTTLQVIKK